MTQEDIIAMAREAEIPRWCDHEPLTEDHLIRFATLAQAAERNKLAAWMMAQGYATGHGDTTEDLLKELEWQVRESEREAMLHLALLHRAPWHFQEAIRARGKHHEQV
jgi:hypothetical protein